MELAQTNCPMSDGASGKRKLAVEDLRVARIPRRFWDVRFRDIPDEAPYKSVVKKYLCKITDAVNSGIGLMLWGESGTGKTGAAVVCLKFALRHGFTGLYVMSEDLRQAFRDKTTFDEDTSLIERAERVDILVLDDLGKEFRGSAGVAGTELMNLLRKRVQNKKVVIITTNSRSDQMGEVYGDGIESLLMEATVPVKVYGVDWREKRAEELAEFLDG